MKEVDADLYEFLKNNETGLYRNKDKIIAYVIIDFDEDKLNNFIEIIGVDYFSEGGIDCKIHDKYISIDLNDIIEEWCGQNLSNYKNCFRIDDWDEYKEDILRKEKTVEEFCEEFLNKLYNN